MSLSFEQMRFIAARLHAESDLDACGVAQVSRQTLQRWKHQPEFVQRLEAVKEDGINLALDVIRQQLGDAAVELTAHLRATKGEGEPDYQARHNAIRTMFETHGLIKQKLDSTNQTTVTVTVPWAPKGTDANSDDGAAKGPST